MLSPFDQLIFGETTLRLACRMSETKAILSSCGMTSLENLRGVHCIRFQTGMYETVASSHSHVCARCLQLLLFARPVGPLQLLKQRSMSTCGAPECDTNGCASTKQSPQQPPTRNLSTHQRTVSANPADARATPAPGSPAATANLNYVSKLLASRQQGYSMPGPFYTDPHIYEQDLKQLWHKAWLSVLEQNMLTDVKSFL